MTKPPLDLSKLRLETRLALAGRDASRFEGAVNPPVHRATTVLLDEPGDLYSGKTKTYALEGMAVQEALREALVGVEGGADAVLAPSGLGAVTLALLSVAREGSELLVTDAAYAPTRRFCDTMLKRFGVSTRYYDPRIGAGIADLITDGTCALFMESPGSVTMEFQDVPAIARVAKAKGVPTIIDNTWSAGVWFKPFDHGVDLSVQALTKYQSGHADAFLGAVLCATPQWAERVRAAYKQLGLGASPDDAYLVLRGIRSLAVRLERQGASALAVARWLETRPEVARVLHPSLESSQDHAIWKRDFSGSSGLFSFVLRPIERQRVERMLGCLSIFAMGFSWGGYESLAIPGDPHLTRGASTPKLEGELVRLSIGLEHPDDLIADLERGFATLR